MNKPSYTSVFVNTFGSPNETPFSLLSCR